MKKISILLLLSIVLLCGCHEHQPTQEEIIDKMMDETIERLSHPGKPKPQNNSTTEKKNSRVYDEVISQISTLTNDSVSVQYLEKYAHRLMNIDLRNERYYYQTRFNDHVEHLIWFYIGCGLSCRDADVRRSCQIRFELIEWLENQFEYLRHRPKVNYAYEKGNPFYDAEFSEWDTTCSKLYHGKVLCLCDFEDPDCWGGIFPKHARTAEGKARIRSCVEELLGRPLRTKAEIRRARNNISNDYMNEMYPRKDTPSAR